MFSALQYMDVHRVFAEVKRLLGPDGLAINLNMPLTNKFRVRLQRAMQERSAHLAVSAGAIVTDTLWYQWFGTWLRRDVSGDATARPIHPTESFLIAAAEKAGLRYRSDLSFHDGAYFGLVMQNG